MSSATRPASRGNLSRERITAAAVSVIERDGYEMLSMRRLAEELEIGTMTLYGYFRNKEELLDALVDSAAEEIRVPTARGPWRKQIATLMEEIRKSLGDHPIGVVIRQRRPMWSAGALRVSEAGIRILREAGFSKADAARSYRTLFNYTFGFVAFSPGELSAKQREAALQALAALPRERYPMQLEAAAELADAVGGETQFRYGLELLLDGLEAKLKKRRAK